VFLSREYDLPKVALNCLHPLSGEVEPVEMLSRFRRDIFACLAGRPDAMCEQTDAQLCLIWPVRSLVGCHWHRIIAHGHGGLHDGLSRAAWR
jgi:hypothetical protein